MTDTICGLPSYFKIPSFQYMAHFGSELCQASWPWSLT